MGCVLTTLLKVLPYAFVLPYSSTFDRRGRGVGATYLLLAFLTVPLPLCTRPSLSSLTSLCIHTSPNTLLLLPISPSPSPCPPSIPSASLFPNYPFPFPSPSLSPHSIIFDLSLFISFSNRHSPSFTLHPSLSIHPARPFLPLFLSPCSLPLPVLFISLSPMSLANRQPNSTKLHHSSSFCSHLSHLPHLPHLLLSPIPPTHMHTSSSPPSPPPRTPSPSAL